MEALSKEITNEIRFILEGCRDGKLKHKQEDFHCGTRHCIAGWKTLLDYSAEISDPKILTSKRLDYRWEKTLAPFFKKHGVTEDDNIEAWSSLDPVYAQKEWKLSRQEAYQLFSPYASFDSQFALLEKLEAGERVE